MSLYKRGGIWWSRIVRNGERLDRSTKQRSKTGAQAVEARWLTAINDTGELSTVKQVRQQRPLSLGTFRDRFFAYLTNSVKSPRTVEFYKQAYQQLLWPGVEISTAYLSGITPAVIEEWIQRRSTEVGPARINASLRTLRRALRMAEDWKLIRKAPKIKMLPGERQREFVIKEELLKDMLAHEDCTPFLRDALPFLIDTGLRISEACALRWEHVGLEPKTGATLGWVYVEKGKSKYAKRHVPLTARARGILEKIKEKLKSNWVKLDGNDAKDFQNYIADKYVFPAKDKTSQLSRHWASEQFRTLRDAMKLPDDCVVHSTRHTFCTRLGESGVGAFEIQRLAGHSSIVISQRYVHPTPALLESAIGKMGQANGG
ncbi:MAG TPA: tyrosine-type recombinase/integrase [Candidatus Sulfotelmatobacter sp.]|nr:tyrosine-type recombinase/integrase [Candidatus Sulfotelmatobacter sp.]